MPFIKYPPKFKDDARAVYPDFAELHEAIANGDDDKVQRLLYDKGRCLYRPNSEDIVRLIDNGQVDKIRQEAEEHIKRLKLYGDFTQLLRTQSQPISM